MGLWAPALGMFLAAWTAPARAEGPAAEAWEVILEVAAPGQAEQARIVVTGSWLSEERRVQLVDHGADPRDRAGDQVWFAAWSGQPVRYLPVRIEAEAPGHARAVVYEGTERVEGPEDRLTWELVEEDGRLVALRVARPRVGLLAPLRDERVRVLAAGLWALLVLNLAGWLWRLRERESR